MLGGISIKAIPIDREWRAMIFLVIASVLFSISVAVYSYFQASQLVNGDDGDLWGALVTLREKVGEHSNDLEKIKAANVKQVDKITVMSAKQRQRGPKIEAASMKAEEALDRVFRLEGRVQRLEATIPQQQKPWFGGHPR